MIIKTSNCDWTQNLIFFNLKTPIVINSKTQMVTKLKNSNGDKTPKVKWWQNSKSQIVTKLKKTQVVTKLKLWENSNCDNSNCYKTQNVTTLEVWANSKNQIVTKLKKM